MMFFPLLGLFIGLLGLGMAAEPSTTATISAHDASTLSNDVGISHTGNTTFDEERGKLLESVGTAAGCDIAQNFQAATYVECTEWCDADDPNVLRYHV